MFVWWLSACSPSDEQKQTIAEPPTPVEDSTTNLADVVDTATFQLTDSTISLRRSQFPNPGGKVINVMVTGVDSRLGDYGAHADANHLVRCFIDSGMVEIISIPRDTYADAGFEDSTGLNKLANVRAVKGRTAYLKAVSEITGVSPIHHWVEFGFSQAIGLLELLGYKDNASSALHVLRSRQAYRAGDFQRSFNQGRFIRAALLKQVPKGTDLVQSLMLRAGLMMVETDVSYGTASELINGLASHGFSGEESRAWVRIEPPVVLHVQAVDFDSANIGQLDKEISRRVAPLLKDSNRVTANKYENRLASLLTRADSSRRSADVIRLLRRPYEQRAWLQITNKQRRIEFRDRLCSRLEQAYVKIGRQKDADQVRTYLDEERKAFGY